jgi:enoyl-CoA hydratase
VTRRCFQLETVGRVAHLILCRPERRNSMIPEFWEELPALMAAIDASSDYRVIVISSMGPHFTSGLDTSMLAPGNPASAFAPDERAVDPETQSPVPQGPVLYEQMRMQRAISAVEQCRIPVIAAVQGACIGGGMDLITACCLRYATSDAYFSIHEINIGVTADVGTFPRASRVLPEGLVRELAYTGRKMPADEARAVGFLNGIFTDHAALLTHTLNVAQQIARKAPLAVYGAKRMINYARDHSTADCLDYVSLWNASHLDHKEVLESIHAATENRDGRFASLPRQPLPPNRTTEK